MKRIVLSAAILGTLAGCAQQPKNISAAYVSPSVYSGRSCSQLLAERNKIVEEVNQLTEQQKKKATDDAVATGVALVLFWPAAFFLMAGEDQKPQLAQAKGNYDAITEAMEQKRCRVPSA